MVKDIEKIGEVKIFWDNPSKEELLQRIHDTDIAVVESAVIDAWVIQQSRGLRAIVAAATGYSNIDVKAARGRRIKVYHVPGYATEAVTEHIIRMCLWVAERCSRGQSDGIICPVELKGKAVGIIGMGRIGRSAARALRGIGMQIQFYSTHKDDRQQPGYLPIKKLLASSFIVIICIPLRSNNKHFLNADKLAYLSPGTSIINISPAEVIDESALLPLLEHRILSGAALEDVHDASIGRFQQVLLTHNRAWRSCESEMRFAKMLKMVLRSAVNGDDKYRVVR